MRWCHRTRGLCWGVDALRANFGLTIGYELLIRLPTPIIAGPLLARFTARGVVLGEQAIAPERLCIPPPPIWRTLVVVMPVALIAAGQYRRCCQPG